MVMDTDILVIEMSDNVRAKLSGKHNLSEDDVVFACGDGLERAGWEDDPEHGRRLLVRGQTPNKRRIRVFLYPIPGESGAFRLGTAF